MSLTVTLIAGSARKQSQSAKVANYLGQRLRALGLCESTSVIDLGSAALPLWPEKDVNGLWTDHSAILREADALVMVVPEWHGMASPAMKNFFVHAGYRELGHKPALLVGVSAGQGGAYPLSELRASSYKNCRVCYLPEQLIVRQVEAVMNGEAAANADDQRIRERADWALGVLASYGRAMLDVRQDVDMSRAEFANGM